MLRCEGALPDRLRGSDPRPPGPSATAGCARSVDAAPPTCCDASDIDSQPRPPSQWHCGLPHKLKGFQRALDPPAEHLHHRHQHVPRGCALRPELGILDSNFILLCHRAATHTRTLKGVGLLGVCDGDVQTGRKSCCELGTNITCLRAAPQSLAAAKEPRA